MIPTLIAAFLIIITLFCSAGKSVSLLYLYREEVSKWENKRLKIKFVDFDLMPMK